MLESREETLTTAILGLYKRAVCTLDAIAAEDANGEGDASGGGSGSSGELPAIAARLRELSQSLQALLALEDEAYPLETEALLRVVERELSSLVSYARTLINSITTGKSW